MDRSRRAKRDAGLGSEHGGGCSRLQCYYGLASRTYTCLVPVGNVTNAVISGLQDGTTYFFAVTALNSLGVESLPSSEDSCSVPDDRHAMQLVLSNGIPSSTRVTSGNCAVDQWTLESSPDLHTWSAVTTGTSSTVNVSLSVQAAPMLFFRLKEN